MNKNITILVGVVLLFLVGGMLWFSNNSQNLQGVLPESTNNTNTESAPSVTTNPAADDSNSMVNDVLVIEMEAGDFAFTPNEIRVKKGQKVKVVLTSKDMKHDFVIDELNVAMPEVEEGNTGEVEFTADTVGTFEFYCSVGDHRAMGQVGKLIVE